MVAHYNISHGRLGLWSVAFEIRTATPPRIALTATLPDSPVYQPPGGPANYVESCVSVNLRAAVHALIHPIVANGRLVGDGGPGSNSGVILSLVPGDAIVCFISWMAAGLGPIITTVYIPPRL